MSSLTLIWDAAGTAVEPQKDLVLSGFCDQEPTLFPCSMVGFEPWLGDVYKAQGFLVSHNLGCHVCGLGHRIPVSAFLCLWQNCEILAEKNAHRYMKPLVKCSPRPPAGSSSITVYTSLWKNRVTLISFFFPTSLLKCWVSKWLGTAVGWVVGTRPRRELL